MYSALVYENVSLLRLSVASLAFANFFCSPPVGIGKLSIFA